MPATMMSDSGGGFSHYKQRRFSSKDEAIDAKIDYNTKASECILNHQAAQKTQTAINNDIQTITDFEANRLAISNNLSTANDEFGSVTDVFTEEGAFYNGAVSYAEQLTLLNGNVTDILSVMDTDMVTLLTDISQKYSNNLDLIGKVVDFWNDEITAYNDAIDAIIDDLNSGHYDEKDK